MIRSLLFVAAFSLAAPVTAQAVTDFARANSNADAQRQKDPVSTSIYADAWAEFNNQHRLDERDDCYFQAEGELTQVLEIDAAGTVVSYFADKDNGRSRCWSRTYLGVVFPKPPFAPYWHKLVMQ
jgi:hypothetical protein